MGYCKYCGKPAGFWRNTHEACEQSRMQREQQEVEKATLSRYIEVSVLTAIVESSSDDEFDQALNSIESQQNVRLAERKDTLIQTWQKSSELITYNNVVNVVVAKNLIRLREKYSLTNADLDTNGAYTKFVKALVVHDLVNGIVSPRVNIKCKIPINLQPGEVILWYFDYAEYYEDKTYREWVGREPSTSVHLMKGVNCRMPGFRGTPVERTERVHIDTGVVFVTTINIYFVGPKKATRIPYTKIVAFQPYRDGVGIIRDTANAKPQVLVTGDGWFTYNLLINIPKQL